MTFTDTILFSLLAAVLSLDQMACFQVLLSRPIATALILGAAFGDVTEAALVGICFEFLFVRSIPLKERAAADPTLATAAVLGGMWGAPLPGNLPALHPLAAAPFAAALGLSAAFLSKWFDLRLRGVNTILFHRLHRIGSVQVMALGALFAKSFGFYILTVLAVQGALPRIMASLGPTAPTAASFAWAALICISIAYASVPLIHGAAGFLWASGLMVGLFWVMGLRALGGSAAAVAGTVAATMAIFAAVESVLYFKRKAAAG